METCNFHQENSTTRPDPRGTSPCSTSHGSPSTRLMPTPSLTTILAGHSYVCGPATPELPLKASLQRWSAQAPPNATFTAAHLAWVAPLAHFRIRVAVRQPCQNRIKSWHAGCFGHGLWPGEFARGVRCDEADW